MQISRHIHQLFTWYVYKGKHGSGLWDNAAGCRDTNTVQGVNGRGTGGRGGRHQLVNKYFGNGSP